MLSGVLITAPAAAQSAPVVVGAVVDYTVRPGDTLTLISARFGVPVATLLRQNGRSARARLSPGDQLTIDHRHIATVEPDRPLMLNVAQHMIFFASDAGVEGYPIGVGRRSWPSPVGAFTITQKEENPTWDVPVSIQEEMRSSGKPVLTRVPPGPDNPLGLFFMRTSFFNVGIHGTNAPASVFTSSSHGCIRMQPEHIALLFQKVQVGTAGLSVYAPVLLGVAGDRVFVEVHPDIYRRGPEPLARLQQLAAEQQVESRIDWKAVAEVVKLRPGVAVDVTLR